MKRDLNETRGPRCSLHPAFIVIGTGFWIAISASCGDSTGDAARNEQREIENACLDICKKLRAGHCPPEFSECLAVCVRAWGHCENWSETLVCFKENPVFSCEIEPPPCQTHIDELEKCEASQDGGVFASCTPGELLPACYCSNSRSSAYPCPPTGKYLP